MFSKECLDELIFYYVMSSVPGYLCRKFLEVFKKYHYWPESLDNIVEQLNTLAGHRELSNMVKRYALFISMTLYKEEALPYFAKLNNLQELRWSADILEKFTFDLLTKATQRIYTLCKHTWSEQQCSMKFTEVNT